MRTLAQARRDAGLSRSELAARMTTVGHPLDPGQIKMIEKGTRPATRGETDSLSKALGTQLDYT